MKKETWLMWSGEGERGTKKIVETTERGIKRMLTRERCGGDRWAHAARLSDMPAGNQNDTCITARDFRLHY